MTARGGRLWEVLVLAGLCITPVWTQESAGRAPAADLSVPADLKPLLAAPQSEMRLVTLLYNTGAAFNFLADASGWQRWFFIVLGVLVSAAILVWLRQLDPRRHRLLAAGLALIMGGALGNVIDRVWHGHVIDFIHFHWRQWEFPAFNMADTSITIGAGLLILDAILESRRSDSAPAVNR